MPLQNRVDPYGEVHAVAARGTLMGNRGGCLHDGQRRLGRARWRSRARIACVLDFKDRRRAVMAPGRYTELFFLDEATALAAGHRPCVECRRADFLAFAAAWPHPPANGRRLRVAEVDAVLHADRRASTGTATHWKAAAADLPDGTMVERPDRPGRPLLLVAGALRCWSFAGYGAPESPPDGPVTVLTPKPLVAVLAAGYRPRLHPTAAV